MKRMLLALLLLLPGGLRAQAAVPRLPSGAGNSPIAGAGAAAAARGPAAPAVPDFTMSTRRMVEVYKSAEKAYLSAVADVVALPKRQRDFDNTVRALDSANSRYTEAVRPMMFLAAVSPDRRVRRMAEAIERRVSSFGLAQGLREDVYAAYKDYERRGESLGQQEQQLLDDALAGYRYEGMDLPLEKRVDLKAIRTRLEELEQAFEQNIVDDDSYLEVEESRLAGLPADYMGSLQRTDAGQVRLTLDEPTYRPLMRYVQDSGLRRELYLKYNNRAVEKNLPILEEALALRGRMAKILGERSYAHLALQGRMADSPRVVLKFLNRIKRLLRPAFRQEQEALLDMKRRDEPDAQRVESWEETYYADRLRKERYDLDAEEVRQYFPVERVVAGTLEVYQELLGVRFQEIAAPTWHPDVRVFEIRNAQGAKPIAYFYLDLFPREGKYTHQAAFTVTSGRKLEAGGYRLPIEAMVANLAKPTPGQPTLMTHAEVETFFHEFGHLMHGTLTKAKYASHSGANVALDFMEAPSQMMENFVWTTEVLVRVSGHWQDPDRHLPPDLLARMLAARRFRSASDTLDQVAYAAMDLAFNLLPGSVDTTKVMAQVYRAVGLSAPVPGTHMQASFGHLMGGYGSGYYSYLWSLAFAQDMFSRFEADGVLNPETGRDYRKQILEPGSSRAEMLSMRRFLGRDPDELAFMRLLGVGPQSPDQGARMQLWRARLGFKFDARRNAPRIGYPARGLGPGRPPLPPRPPASGI